MSTSQDKRRAALKRVVDIIGGQSELARILGVRQSHVANWLNRDQQVTPAEHCHAIEIATEGRVRAYELRPDVFPKPAAAA